MSCQVTTEFAKPADSGAYLATPSFRGTAGGPVECSARPIAAKRNGIVLRASGRTIAAVPIPLDRLNPNRRCPNPRGAPIRQRRRHFRASERSST
jgi:hypothetical protein